MRKKQFFVTLLIFITAFAGLSHATVYDHAYIENFAKQQLESIMTPSGEEQITVSVTPIDPRIIIKPCYSDFEANIPQNHNGRNVNIEITCADSRSWSIYLPARIQIMTPVVVALSAIDKGSLLTSENIGIKLIDSKKIRGEKITSSFDIIGAKSKRNLSQGSAITRKNICIVCKGDSVTIEASSNLLSIKTAGIALMNGHTGDKIRVKNQRSGKMVSAQVTGLNKVKINL